MRLQYMRCPWLLIPFASVHLVAQAVVSTHSGTVNYSEGAVFLDNSPVNQQVGTFSTIPEGSTLRTEKGRAEVLLTPGVFLRIDENSAIRMLSNSLTNTRVEFLEGGAILDSNDAPADNPCVLVYKTYELRFVKAGVYRMSSEPAVFQTYTGEAEIQASGEPPNRIDESNQFFFSIGLAVKKNGDGMVDNFSEWARNRAETIASENQIASQSTADPSAGDPNNSPFSLPPSSQPAPWFGQQSSGPSSPTLFVDNGFMGPWGIYTGVPFFNPPVIIYIVPRKYVRYPVATPSPHRPGYPTMPVRTGYPIMPVRPGFSYTSPYRPGPMPTRSTYGYARPSVGQVRISAPPPRIATPRVAAPAAVRPMAVPHR
jgi:hypothetical protein